MLRLLVSCLTIFVIWSGPAHAGPSDLSGQTFAERVKIELGQKLDWQSVATLQSLTSGHFSQFRIPNWWHDPGVMHSSIFRFSKDGQSRLIKTIMPGSPGYISDAHFEQDVLGMLLASHNGGPEIFRAGRIMDANGELGYYVDMEEVFPQARDTYTYKGVGGKARPLRWLVKHFPNEPQLQKIARIIRINLERGISIGIDPDLIFSGNDVRWIDAVEWRFTEHRAYDTDIDGLLAIFNYGSFITELFRLQPHEGRFLVQTLKTEILNSDVWSSEQKTAILSNLKDVLVNQWRWSEADYLGTPVKPPSFIEKCSTFLAR